MAAAPLQTPLTHDYPSSASLTRTDLVSLIGSWDASRPSAPWYQAHQPGQKPPGASAPIAPVEEHAFEAFVESLPEVKAMRAETGRLMKESEEKAGEDAECMLMEQTHSNLACSHPVTLFLYCQLEIRRFNQNSSHSAARRRRFTIELERSSSNGQLSTQRCAKPTSASLPRRSFSRSHSLPPSFTTRVNRWPMPLLRGFRWRLW